MTKSECLVIEAEARDAVSNLFGGIAVKNARISLGSENVTHEFDIYAKDLLIGGVSTSPLKTSGGKSNTGGRDRACSELLWLSLWSGKESRIHVLTDRALAEWLVTRYKGISFPSKIDIYFYNIESKILIKVGMLSKVNVVTDN